MKLFVSQPMNGRTTEDILKEREALIQEAKSVFGEDFEVIDSLLKDNAKPLTMLGKTIQLLSTADAAVFSKDWNLARGCTIEHKCCIEYGIKILLD